MEAGTATVTLRLTIHRSMITLYSLGSCRVSESNRRPRFLEADRESIGVLPATSSLPIGPHGRDYSFGHGQAALSVVLALRHSPRLVILSRAGKLGDTRTVEALDIVEKKRGPDGLWYAEDYYWIKKRKVSKKVKVSNVEVVNWGRKGPNEFITLNALRVLKASGRKYL